jgi:hypothetical protein
MKSPIKRLLTLAAVILMTVVLGNVVAVGAYASSSNAGAPVSALAVSCSASADVPVRESPYVSGFGGIQCSANTDEIGLDVCLQYYTGGTWSLLGCTSGQFYGYSGYYLKHYEACVVGRRYRTETYGFYVYGGVHHNVAAAYSGSIYWSDCSV